MTEQAWTRRCAWCEAAAPKEATSCPACGAALAQREDVGGLVIPGVTSVDPALAAFDARPHHLAGGSPTQSIMSSVIPAAMLGGPLAVVTLGGIATVAAAEYLGARRDGASTPATLEAVGRASEAALRAVARLDRGETLGDPSAEPSSAEPSSAEPPSAEPRAAEPPPADPPAEASPPA